jgi:hypothetical protein
MLGWNSANADERTNLPHYRVQVFVFWQRQSL